MSRRAASASASTACSRASHPTARSATSRFDVTSDSGQLAILPFYRLLEWQYGMSSSGAPLRLVVAPEAGFRFTYMRTEIDVHPGRTVDGSESWVDPLIGSRIGLGPHRPLRAHRRGQPRRLRGRCRLHLERPGLCRLRDHPVRPADHAAARLSRALSGLSPQQFRVGRDHARPGHRDRGALLNALKGNKCKESGRRRPRFRTWSAPRVRGDGRELLRRTAPGGCFAALVFVVIQEARPI